MRQGRSRSCPRSAAPRSSCQRGRPRVGPALRSKALDPACRHAERCLLSLLLGRRRSRPTQRALAALRAAPCNLGALPSPRFHDFTPPRRPATPLPLPAPDMILRAAVCVSLFVAPAPSAATIGVLPQCNTALADGSFLYCSGRPRALGAPLQLGSVFSTRRSRRDPPAVEVTPRADALESGDPTLIGARIPLHRPRGPL